MYNEKLTRKETELLLKLFNRNSYHLEHLQIKALKIFTNNIQSNLENMNLTEEDIKLVNSEEFKDIVFDLFQEHLVEEDLKVLSNPKVDANKYTETIALIGAYVIASFVGEANPKYDKLATIISEYYNYLDISNENDI